LYWILFVTKWQKFAKEKNAGTWKVKQFGFYTQYITHLLSLTYSNDSQRGKFWEAGLERGGTKQDRIPTTYLREHNQYGWVFDFLK
jgi:hypothetical protein